MLQELPISGHEDLGPSGRRTSQNPQVRLVFDGKRGRLRRTRNGFKLPQERLDRFQSLRGHLELPGQYPPELVHDRGRQYESMLGHDMPDYIGTQSTGRKGSDQDVRIQADSHLRDGLEDILIREEASGFCESIVRRRASSQELYRQLPPQSISDHVASRSTRLLADLAELLPLVRAGVNFIDGEQLEREDQEYTGRAAA